MVIFEVSPGSQILMKPQTQLVLNLPKTTPFSIWDPESENANEELNWRKKLFISQMRGDDKDFPNKGNWIKVHNLVGNFEFHKNKSIIEELSIIANKLEVGGFDNFDIARIFIANKIYLGLKGNNQILECLENSKFLIFHPLPAYSLIKTKNPKFFKEEFQTTNYFPLWAGLNLKISQKQFMNMFNDLMRMPNHLLRIRAQLAFIEILAGIEKLNDKYIPKLLNFTTSYLCCSNVQNYINEKRKETISYTKKQDRNGYEKLKRKYYNIFPVIEKFNNREIEYFFIYFLQMYIRCFLQNINSKTIENFSKIQNKTLLDKKIKQEDLGFDWLDKYIFVHFNNKYLLNYLMPEPQDFKLFQDKDDLQKAKELSGLPKIDKEDKKKLTKIKKIILQYIEGGKIKEPNYAKEILIVLRHIKEEDDKGFDKNYGNVVREYSGYISNKINNFCGRNSILDLLILEEFEKIERNKISRINSKAFSILERIPLGKN